MNKDNPHNIPEDATSLSPLDMNKLAILKDHTVITFSQPEPRG